jgi:hypothetical protein
LVLPFTKRSDFNRCVSSESCGNTLGTIKEVSMLSRRELVGKAAVGAAAVLTTGVARAAVGSATRRVESSAQSGPVDAVAGDTTPATSSIPSESGALGESGPLATQQAPAPWEILQPLTVGSTVVGGWKLAGLTGAVHGSCVVTLENERGRQNRVHICRNDGKPNGIVFTDRFDLVAMNGGKGDLPTEESFARAIAELSHVLAANEDRSTVVASLVPHAERLSTCGESDRRLR